MRLAVSCVVLSLLIPKPVAALPAQSADAMIAAARRLLGTPYEFGGRMRAPDEGTDCQGVLFAAAEAVQPCGWRSFSTKPTRSVADGELGAAVPGLSPVRGEDLDPVRLEPGDIILFVGYDENPKEPSLANLTGRAVWVWHTGMYTGGGRFIVGDHIAGEVVETDLGAYLRDNRDAYPGLFVTRMTDGPRPRRCREHPALGAGVR